MTKLERSKATLIDARFHGPGRVAGNEKLIAALRAGTAMDSKFWQKNRIWVYAKPSLREETGGKCAYCEATTQTVAFGDVEHFRPKSRYWWLAFCYFNYTYSCQICNQQFKGDWFDVEGESWPVPKPSRRDLSDVEWSEFAGAWSPDPADETVGLTLAEYRRLVSAERSLLPDPYVDDPNELFAWRVDEVNKEVRLVAATKTARNLKVLRAVEERLGLNRPELLKDRYDVYALLDAFLLVIEDGRTAQLDRVKSEVRRMAASKARYAGMCQYFLRQRNLDVGG